MDITILVDEPIVIKEEIIMNQYMTEIIQMEDIRMTILTNNLQTSRAIMIVDLDQKVDLFFFGKKSKEGLFRL